MHRLDQNGLEQIAGEERAGGRDQNRKPPQVTAEQIGDGHILDIASQHVEFAHRPIDHPHDAVDERDAQRHQRIDHPDHQSGDERLDEQFGAEHHRAGNSASGE
jgi:hypothetical protein